MTNFSPYYRFISKMLDSKIIRPILENHDDYYSTIEKTPFCPKFPVRREVRFYYGYNNIEEIKETLLLQKILHYYEFAMIEYLQEVKNNARIDDEDYDEDYYMRDTIVKHLHNRYVYPPDHDPRFIR